MIVTSVVSRIGIASTISGSITVATVVPAAVQLAASPMQASPNPSSWLPASPMNTAASAPAAEVVRQEAEAGESEREGEDDDEVVVVHRCASIAKYAQATVASVAASPSMLSRRLNAFVIPTSQTIATCHRDDVVGEELHVKARRDHDRSGRELREQLRAPGRRPYARRGARTTKITVQPATIADQLFRRIDCSDQYVRP